MSKIKYPEVDGISNYVENSLKDPIAELNNALSKCSFNIPSGFAYTNYVRGLSSTINGNIKEANDIVSQAKKIDNIFNLALETIGDKCSSLDTNLLQERDRLVK